MADETVPSSFENQRAAPPAGAPRSDSDRDEAVDFVDAKRALFVHGIVFVGVIAALFVVDAISGSHWWVHWVLIGWGIGVLAHAAAVYLRFSVFGPTWHARELDRHAATRRSDR